MDLRAPQVLGLPGLLAGCLAAARRSTWSPPQVVGLATLITSLLYHVCEVFEARYCWGTRPRKVLAMTCGQWHRLDNVFAILSLQLLCVHLLRVRMSHSHPVQKALPWLAVAVTTWAQERGPWVLSHTVIPIVLFAAPLLVFPPRMSSRWLLVVLITASLA